MSMNKKIKILHPGYYKGEVGYIENILTLVDGSLIYEVKIEPNSIYDCSETILVRESEVEFINN